MNLSHPVEGSWVSLQAIIEGKGEALTFWVWEGGQGDWPPEAQAQVVPIELAEDGQELMQHLQPFWFLVYCLADRSAIWGT